MRRYEVCVPCKTEHKVIVYADNDMDAMRLAVRKSERLGINIDDKGSVTVLEDMY